MEIVLIGTCDQSRSKSNLPLLTLNKRELASYAGKIAMLQALASERRSEDQQLKRDAFPGCLVAIAPRSDSNLRRSRQV